MDANDSEIIKVEGQNTINSKGTKIFQRVQICLKDLSRCSSIFYIAYIDTAMSQTSLKTIKSLITNQTQIQTVSWTGTQNKELER